MSNVTVSIENINNYPVVSVQVVKDTLAKEKIVKSQIESKLGDVFLEDAKRERDSISFIEGIVLERVLSNKKETFFNSSVFLLDEDLSYRFVDNEQVENFYMPKISRLVKNSEYNVSYNVKYFSFPSNLLNLSSIKIEEDIIYKYYNKYNKSLSASRSKKIAEQLKNNVNFVFIDKAFFKTYEKNSTKTNTLKINEQQSFKPSFASKLIYDKNSLLYELSISNGSVIDYDFDIQQISILSLEDKKKISIVQEKTFNQKEIDYYIHNKKVYFNILKKETYNFYLKTYGSFSIKSSIRVYDKITSSLISIKNDKFNLQG